MTAHRLAGPRARAANGGFTLLELMIVVVVVAVLAAIAYPSYQESVRKSRRSDAHAAIAGVQQAQQRLRGNCRFYAQSIGSSDSCGTDASSTTVRAGTTSPEGYYALSIVGGSASGNAYVIEADPQGAQADDAACDPIVLTVDASSPQGEKTPAGCW